MALNKEIRYRLLDELNGVIDQAKFIRNILVNNIDAEREHVKRYIVELKDMTNHLKDYD